MTLSAQLPRSVSALVLLLLRRLVSVILPLSASLLFRLPFSAIENVLFPVVYSKAKIRRHPTRLFLICYGSDYKTQIPLRQTD